MRQLEEAKLQLEAARPSPTFESLWEAAQAVAHCQEKVDRAAAGCQAHQWQQQQQSLAVLPEPTEEEEEEEAAAAQEERGGASGAAATRTLPAARLCLHR